MRSNMRAKLRSNFRPSSRSEAQGPGQRLPQWPHLRQAVASLTLVACALAGSGISSLRAVDALAMTAEIDRLEQTAADEKAAHAATMQQRAAGLSALTNQRDHQRRELAAVQQQVTALEQQLSADPLADQLAAVAAAENQVVAELTQALEHLTQQCVPGVVPESDPSLAPIEDVLRRWDVLQRELQRVSLRVQTGYHLATQQEIAAQVIVFGGVSALWISLDGGDGGLVRSSSGQGSHGEKHSSLQFESLPAALPALRAAIAQHAGQAPAGWLWLPVHDPITINKQPTKQPTQQAEQQAGRKEAAP